MSRTIRADKFEEAAPSEVLESIQGQALLHHDDLTKYLEESDLKDYEKANAIMGLYLRIAIDEGYRFAAEDILKTNNHNNKELKPHSKEVVEYVEEHEPKQLLKLIQRRFKSKRQRKWRTDHCLETGVEDTEESFQLSMVIHTGYEFGTMKANTVEEISKIICKDEETANMVSDMFKEFAPQLGVEL